MDDNAKTIINVAGDNVQTKHVDYEIGNVEAGGIGVQIINNGSPVNPEQQQSSENKEKELESTTPKTQQEPDEELTDGSIDLHLQLFRNAMLKVQTIKYSEIKYAKAISNTYDWQAVIRLGQDIGLLDGYTDLIRLMKNGKFNCIPTNPQNVNPYRKYINPEPIYPNWQCSHPGYESTFHKFKFIADNTYSIYCLGCKQHYIRPFGPGK